jgi:hypothetical protein
MNKLLTVIILGASLGVATAGPTEFPLYFHGTTARVFTLSGQRCVGTVDEWTPQLMTVRMYTSGACGAVNFLLRITPSDVRKVDYNPPSPWRTSWHAVTRPCVVIGTVAVYAAVGLFVVLDCLFTRGCSP